MKKPRLHPIEARILTILVKEGDYMNTSEIARLVGVSWNTAFTPLRRLEAKGWVESGGDVKKYWIARTPDDYYEE